ncbi:MAG: helix-turn-helix transcriptional regulator [Thermoleophilia bacterium]|nr:helix-turn-helix transcriptional regulator [Thermoleophilia bacterium]
MRSEQTKGQLDLLLLAELAHGRAHGYALIEALRERSGGAFDLAEGTVYPALHRLEQAGAVASEWREVAGRRRRVYRLTRRGRRALEAEQRRWRDFARAVDVVAGVAR